MNQNDIRVTYIRNKDQNTGQVSSRGGLTIAYLLTAAGVLQVSGTVCRNDEGFNRKIGRAKAIERLTSGNPAFISEFDIVKQLTDGYIEKSVLAMSTHMLKAPYPVDNGPDAGDVVMTPTLAEEFTAKVRAIMEETFVINNIKPAHIHQAAVRLFMETGANKVIKEASRLSEIERKANRAASIAAAAAADVNQDPA